MLSKKLENAINEQINAELWSAYLYLSMSMDAEVKGNKGVANWFYVQFQEEQAHARIFMNYINARGGVVKLMPIAKVATEWKTTLDAFKDTFAHEEVVTGLINNIAHIAHEEKDYATTNMLNWFIDEQVEEEEGSREIIDALEKISDSKYGLYMYDKELAERTFITPSPLGA